MALTDSSIPCNRSRDERYALLLAGADTGRTMVECWCLSSDSEPKPNPTPGLRVSASRAHKRVADRVAWLKRKRAEAQNQDIETLTAGRLQELMEETTGALMEAASAAQCAGSNGIACE